MEIGSKLNTVETTGRLNRRCHDCWSCRPLRLARLRLRGTARFVENRFVNMSSGKTSCGVVRLIGVSHSFEVLQAANSNTSGMWRSEVRSMYD